MGRGNFDVEEMRGVCGRQPGKFKAEGLGGAAAPPVGIKFPWCTIKPKSLYRYKINMAI